MPALVACVYHRNGLGLEVEPTYILKNRRGARIVQLINGYAAPGQLPRSFFAVLSDGRMFHVAAVAGNAPLVGSPALQAFSDRLQLAQLRQNRSN